MMQPMMGQPMMGQPMMRPPFTGMAGAAPGAAAPGAPVTMSTGGYKLSHLYLDIKSIASFTFLFCDFKLSSGPASQSPKKPKDPLADLDLKDFL